MEDDAGALSISLCVSHSNLVSLTVCIHKASQIDRVIFNWIQFFFLSLHLIDKWDSHNVFNIQFTFH